MGNMMRKFIFTLYAISVLAVGLLVFSASWAWAAFPDRTVTIISPWPPGGSADIIARLLAAQLAVDLGKPFVVVSKEGASSGLGAELVAKSKADGYTLMATTASTVVINPIVTAGLPYKAADFVGVSTICEGAFAVVANNKFPAKTVKDFVAYAKGHPGEVTYATNGPGTFTALLGALVESELGIKMRPIPYQGATPAMTALMGGEVDANIEGVSNGLSNIHDGRYLAIAVAGEERHPLLPNIPTFKETGYQNIIGPSVHAVYAPAGTPADVVNILSSAIARVSNSSDYNEKIERLGQQVKTRTPEQFKAMLAEDIARWTAVVKSVQ